MQNKSKSTECRKWLDNDRQIVDSYETSGMYAEIFAQLARWSYMNVHTTYVIALKSKLNAENSLLLRNYSRLYYQPVQ